MLSLNRILICCVVSIFATLFGCSPAASSFTTGMKTQDAIDMMDRHGIKSQQMAYSITHHAFDLPDGRTIVLIGSPTVSEIQVVANPDSPKAERKITIVQTVRF